MRKSKGKYIKRKSAPKAVKRRLEVAFLVLIEKGASGSGGQTQHGRIVSVEI